VDGSPHLNQQDYDDERTVFLESKGYRVLRFWNGDVLNDIEGIMSVVLKEISGYT
jgi:very-short-patch-repair endonuclease